MNTRYERDYGQHDTHPVAAGLLGAVAGAAIGVALASIMSDPEKRKIVGKQLQDMQTWGNKTLQDLRDKSLQTKEAAEETIGSAAKKAERIQNELDDSTRQSQAKTK